MPVWIRKMDAPGDFKDAEGVLIEYGCDEESDVPDLPTGTGETDWEKKPRPGSTAIVVDTANVYMLKSNRTWKNIIK